VRPVYDRHDDTRVTTARSHLVEVVEAKLGPAKRKDSRSLFWPCPFHAGDRDPSFKVDLKEPFYRCFGCEARGDVFTFLREIEGRDFKDALRELAPPKLLGAAIPW
jgi:DNA primase